MFFFSNKEEKQGKFQCPGKKNYKFFITLFIFHNDDDDNKDVFLYYHDQKIRGEEKVKIPIGGYTC